MEVYHEILDNSEYLIISDDYNLQFIIQQDGSIYLPDVERYYSDLESAYQKEKEIYENKEK
jgi:hypothetical protein